MPVWPVKATATTYASSFTVKRELFNKLLVHDNDDKMISSDNGGGGRGTSGGSSKDYWKASTL